MLKNALNAAYSGAQCAGFHTTRALAKGGPRTQPKKKRAAFGAKTVGASRTKLADPRGSSPFRGRTRPAASPSAPSPSKDKADFTLRPYGRLPSRDPKRNELSATELYMRARARVAGGKEGGSVYRTGEWNDEVKAKPRAYGIRADVRGDGRDARPHTDGWGDARPRADSRARGGAYGLRGDDAPPRDRPVWRGDGRGGVQHRPDAPFVPHGAPESAKGIAEAQMRSRGGFGLRASAPQEDPADRWTDRDSRWREPDSDAPRRRQPGTASLRRLEPELTDDLSAAAARALEERFAPPPSLRKVLNGMAKPDADGTEPVTPPSAGITYESPRREGIPSEFTNTPLIQPPPPPPVDNDDALPMAFTSPPLMSGLVASVTETLGASAAPTPIQQLALAHLVSPPYAGDIAQPGLRVGWSQTLLAAETGSGKTLAYLLPVLHALKHTELHPVPTLPPPHSTLPGPRALVLAPTHELARQLATSAKALSHVVKLRVQCASRANRPSSGGPGARIRDMEFLRPAPEPGLGVGEGEFVITRESAAELGLGAAKPARPVDVLTATPASVLELVRGNGWERAGEMFRDEQGRAVRAWEVGPRMMGLERVEWVVVDEADVLLDPDFRDHTLGILDDIKAARAHVPSAKLPFHLILNSATIPGLLSATIDERWPAMRRLASPGVHRLPAGMRTEHVGATGNRMSDVAERIRSVWAEDGRRAGEGRQLGGADRSKVLVFVNKGSKAAELSAYLSEKAIANIALTGTHGRAKGSNRHLAGFLKNGEDAREGVDVLITTSLLSRGLDFSPRVRHVLVVDEPRNVVDLLHRAGRSARAGHEGTLTVFGKGPKGAKEVGRAVRGLEADSAPAWEERPRAREERPRAPHTTNKVNSRPAPRWIGRGNTKARMRM